MSTVVPRKTTGEFVSKRVVAFMKELGCEMSVVTLKTDNEPALVAVADDVAKVRASRGAQRTIMENSPAHSSESNGVIERGVQTIQGMVRTLRSAIEERWMVKLDPENALWTWLVEYAGWLVNRAEVGQSVSMSRLVPEPVAISVEDDGPMPLTHARVPPPMSFVELRFLLGLRLLHVRLDQLGKVLIGPLIGSLKTLVALHHLLHADPTSFTVGQTRSSLEQRHPSV